MYLCGVYNGRIGDLSDTVEGIDTVPNRTPIYKIVPSHGEPLIDFIQGVNDCLIPEYMIIIHVFHQDVHQL